MCIIMGRIQCLVCITAMMSSVLSQRGYYQNPYQPTYPPNPYEGLHGRNQQYSQPITENLYTRTQEARKHKIEIIQEHPRIENGTYYPLIIKRGGLTTNLYKILLMELRATIGTLEKYGSELNDRVVFPGPTSKEPSAKKPEGPKITEECRKRGYCGSNEVLNYPNEDVAKLVAQLGDKVKDFQMDVLDDDVHIAQRLGGGSSEQEIPLCTINETIIYPQSLPDRDGKWWYVLNQDGIQLQGFLAELCKTENSSCSAVANFQDGYKGTCKQKFVYRMVEALEDDRKTRVQKLLRLPGCCSCVVTTVNSSF